MNDRNFEKFLDVVERLKEINMLLNASSRHSESIKFYTDNVCTATISFESKMDPLRVDIIDALQLERERLEKEIKKYANL